MDKHIQMKDKISTWLKRINDNESIPKDIKAFNIGIFESEKEYMIYLIGSKEYDTLDDDWACNEDFIPEEKYLGLGKKSKKLDWLDIQNFVKQKLENHIELNVSSPTFLNSA